MSYSLIVPKSVAKQYENLSAEFQNLIHTRLEELQNNPRPHGCKKLKEREGWRICVGKYRIIYEIDDTANKVILISIVHRKDAY